MLPGGIPKWAGRIFSILVGAGILYHEVVLVDSSEFVLVIVGLWLMGFPIANIIDAISGLGSDGGGKERK